MLENEMDYKTLGPLIRNPRLFFGPVKKPFFWPLEECVWLDKN